jgi:hypothetical protein
VNTQRSSAVLNRQLVQEFARGHECTENHHLIARLPIRTIWTTNYDRLIESAFEAAGKRVDRKTTHENLSITLPKRDVTVYKMHGDIEQPHDAVLTKDDYETYSLKRGLFAAALQGDLIARTFLFLGFSFTDPNIDQVLGRIRVLLGQNPREHFWITRRVQPPSDITPAALKEYEYEVQRQAYRVSDLLRYGITAILVDDYSEVTTILQGLVDRVRDHSIFISGSAREHGHLGPERMERLAQRLGSEIIQRKYRLVTGFGLGIGPAVLMGAVGELYRSGEKLEDRVVLRPFPRTAVTDAEKEAVYTRHRMELLREARFTIFIAGNRLGPDGTGVQNGPGVIEEFELGDGEVVPIPIGGTGFAAEEIWRRVSAEPARYFGDADVAEPLATLGRRCTDDEWVAAIFAIVERVQAIRA